MFLLCSKYSALWKQNKILGCGKSFLACAIGRQACAFGYRTLYFPMSKFLEKITVAKLEGTLLKLLSQIEKTHLLILDDFGLQPLDQTTRLTILQILEDRYGRKSTIITSQLPAASWYEYINESTIADAIMDRLSASAHRYELKGGINEKEKYQIIYLHLLQIYHSLTNGSLCQKAGSLLSE